jgi:hypothetical protein
MKITYYQVVINDRTYLDCLDFSEARSTADDMYRAFPNSKIEVLQKTTDTKTKKGHKLTLMAFRQGGF